MEAYPYGAASTGIGAKFLDPENLPRVGLTYASVAYEGKRLNESSFTELRAKNPQAIVVPHFYELPRDQKLLDMAVLVPDGIIASDAMPWLSTKTGQQVDPNTWPPPDDAFSHPRSAGTFSRFISQYVRERHAVSLVEAIAKTAYLPAKLLEDSVPQMKRKGRLQAGMDADIVVFDPISIQDGATYSQPNQTSVGMRERAGQRHLRRRRRWRRAELGNDPCRDSIVLSTLSKTIGDEDPVPCPIAADRARGDRRAAERAARLELAASGRLALQQERLRVFPLTTDL